MLCYKNHCGHKILAMKPYCILSALCLACYLLPAQNVGIGTTTPNANARLHVDVGASATSGILFSGTSVGGATVPDLGAGSRLMFYPGKAAFRVGGVNGTQWDNVNVGRYSMSLGYNCVASGNNSIATGDRTLASGVGSMALGILSVASGLGSVAMGNNSTSQGDNSFAIGTNTTASGYASIAIGNETRSTGFASVAFGDLSYATGRTSTAMGNKTTASHFYSTALGAFSHASGYTSTAMGWLNSASGDYSTAMGMFNLAKGYASTVIGRYNDSILTADQTNILETTPLFIIGNGPNSARSNAMVVLKNGNVGIGSNAPGEKLVLNASASATMQLQAAGVDKAFVQLSGDNLRLGTYSANDFGNVTFRLNGSDRFIILPNGNATLTGTLTQNSDERFKQDITPINNALDKVMRLNGYGYYWKPELQRDSALQIGLIAQNVEKVLPELVATDIEGTKSVAYQNMVPVLIEAMKEQQQRIEQLESKIKELQKSQSPGK
jgi:hypothetical protein